MSSPLAPTKALRDAVQKTVRSVLKTATVVALLTSVVAYLAGGATSGLSALLGASVGIVLALVTWFTMSLAMKNLDAQAALMVGDYLFKVVVVIAVILIVKNLTSLDHTALGLALIISVVGQALVQTWTLARSKVPTIDTPQDGKEQ